jgi:LemA protein
VTYFIVVAVAMAVLAVIIYNGLVRARLRVREGWSAVDVQLQRRTSLIPNLVETVKGYAAYERDTITRVVQSRAALTAAEGPRAAAAANAELTAALGTLFALSEAYPDLKANQSYLLLQHDLRDTENKIAFARNYYNGAVEEYNTRVQSVPGVLVARPFRFDAAEFFTADEGARAVVEVDVRTTAEPPSRNPAR